MKLSKGGPATWEEETTKEAPADYILEIIKKAYPHAEKIENTRERHETGGDWIIHWKTGDKTYVDDKNDKSLGLTGNICIDEKTVEKKDRIQLFVNYPRFNGKYLFVFNNLLLRIPLDEWIHERLQPWGKTTRAYIVPVKLLDSDIYRVHPQLVNPSFAWFTFKRNRGAGL